MAELIELKCPNCGGQMEWVGGPVQVVCPHCGTQFVVPSEVAEYLACPKCGKVDRVQKVSAAYRAGLSVLAPPQEPSPTDWQGILIVPGAMITIPLGGLFTCLALYALNFAFSEGAKDISSSAGSAFGFLVIVVGMLSIGLIGMGLPIWAFRKRASEHRRQYLTEKARWERAMPRWEGLYYCARDDGVFVPGETSLTPIGQPQTYLYAD